MAEQEAKQGTENPQTSEQAGEGTANGGGAGGQVFSQDEVNRMIKARAERELKAVLADVRLADLSELNKACLAMYYGQGQPLSTPVSETSCRPSRQ
ncbi:MAG: hypothetical protein AAGU04_03975 [Anaerolineaceae bacterium]